MAGAVNRSPVSNRLTASQKIRRSFHVRQLWHDSALSGLSRCLAKKGDILNPNRNRNHDLAI